MRSNKYIVRNCPCFVKTFEWCQKVDDYGVCENTTDCLTKQVIEKCKEHLGSLETYMDIRSYECTMLQEILQLFDIEEIK